MRGMATPHLSRLHLLNHMVTRSYLVVRDKAGRPPGELGVSEPMECDIFPSVL